MLSGLDYVTVPEMWTMDKKFFQLSHLIYSLTVMSCIIRKDSDSNSYWKLNSAVASMASTR